MKNEKVTFKLVGLNKKNNFLQAPICECGCGQYANLVLKDDDEVCSFMHTMLEEHECEHCGIFVIKDDKHILMGLKLDGETKCYHANAESDNATDYKNIFKGTQKILKLHCYGLLEQVGEDLYRIVMD